MKILIDECVPDELKGTLAALLQPPSSFGASCTCLQRLRSGRLYILQRMAYWLDSGENSCTVGFCWGDHEVACNQLGGNLAIHCDYFSWICYAAWAAEEQYADVLYRRGDGQ